MADAFDRVAPEWAASDAIQDLLMERTISPEETDFTIGVKRLESYFPLAIQSVGQLALHAFDEKTRLSAAKYVIGANLQLKKLQHEEKASPIESFLEKVAEGADKLQKRHGVPTSPEGNAFLTSQETNRRED